MNDRLSILWLCLLPVLQPAGAAELSKRTKARQGETCLVCNDSVRQGDAAYLVDGQRVAMHAAGHCEGEFLDKPARYLAALRPSSLMFDAKAQCGMSDAWIVLGLYVLLGLVFGGLSAQAALQKGRPPVAWFLAGFLLPVAGYICVVLLPARENAAVPPKGLAKVALTRAPASCAACGGTNHPSAARCEHCGAALVPRSASEVSAVRSESSS